MWPVLSQVFSDTQRQVAASLDALSDAARREADNVREALAGDVVTAGVGASLAAGAAIDPSRSKSRVVDALLAQGWAPWLFLGFVVLAAALLLRPKRK